ncbi:complement C1q-like protein 3 isoform X2 [Melanotaenia boesemani]|uniref:complement C1q-like protein 3 isoform X2 n=1 Tax=Melanotaenia boesemani TaxID=1250792 RepID=UPI001C03FA17|nr:complement C1q-like protein 3 isoform X2 [Melanotaenia boesemani]
MNSIILLSVLFFCGLTLAQNNAAETEVVSETQSCFPDMCKLLQELGAIKENLKAVETRLKESENQILELKSKGATKIAFSAGTGGNVAIGPFNTDTTVIFKNVITNVGNAYNQDTGIFAAPVPGIYYFTFFYHAGGSNRVSLILMKNNQRVVAAYDHQTNHDGADNGGNAVFLQLQQGDQVYVRLGANTHVWGHNEVTTFSGVLMNTL